jgi:hypothetical protein
VTTKPTSHNVLCLVVTTTNQLRSRKALHRTVTAPVSETPSSACSAACKLHTYLPMLAQVIWVFAAAAAGLQQHTVGQGAPFGNHGCSTQHKNSFEHSQPMSSMTRTNTRLGSPAISTQLAVRSVYKTTLVLHRSGNNKASLRKPTVSTLAHNLYERFSSLRHAATHHIQPRELLRPIKASTGRWAQRTPSKVGNIMFGLLPQSECTNTTLQMQAPSTMIGPAGKCLRASLYCSLHYRAVLPCRPVVDLCLVSPTCSWNSGSVAPPL